MPKTMKVEHASLEITSENISDCCFYKVLCSCDKYFYGCDINELFNNYKKHYVTEYLVSYFND